MLGVAQCTSKAFIHIILAAITSKYTLLLFHFTNENIGAYKSETVWPG